MTDNHLTLFCLVDGETTSNAFPVEIESSKTIGDLKKLIKTETPDTFSGVDAKDLTLWRVSISVADDNHDDNDDDDDDEDLPILLDNVLKNDKKRLKAVTQMVTDVFGYRPVENTIHIIVQRPPQVHAPFPSRALTPLPGSLSDGSRPSSPLSGDLHTDIKRITDKFFAPGSDVTTFLNRFVRGLESLPLTTGSVSGLPRVWLRNNDPRADTRPSLLFSDLPHPSPSDIRSRYPTSDAILQLIERCSTSGYTVPIFGVSG
ncbi:hypothetical protein BGZ95_007572, partial [Linnemannia exigua]